MPKKNMKKFDIKKTDHNQWTISHNEHPKFTCIFESKKFIYNKKFIGLKDIAGSIKEVQLLQRMEEWLIRHHKDKMN